MIYKIDENGKILEVLQSDEFRSKYPYEELYISGKFKSGFIDDLKLASILSEQGSFNKNKELLELKRDYRNIEQELESQKADNKVAMQRMMVKIKEKDIEITSITNSKNVLERDLTDIQKEYAELKDKVESIKGLLKTSSVLKESDRK